MEKKTIQSVSRALDILEYISNNGNHCRLQDISDNLNLNKSTAYMLISTLQQRGYVIQNLDSPKYSLGLNCMKLGIIYRRDFFARDKMNEILSRVTEETGETSYFSVRVGDQHFYLDTVCSSKNIKAPDRVGEFVSLEFNDSISKVFNNSAQNEYELDLEEVESGMNAISIPFYEQDTFLGVITICGPSSRFTYNKITESYDLVKKLLK